MNAWRPRRGRPDRLLVVLGVMVAVLLGMVGYFRRRGWL